MKLTSQVKNLAQEIYNDVEHGECFYDEEMFDNFIKNLERMKELSIALYKENQEE